MNTHFSSFVMYIFELEHAKRYQFFDQGIATNHRCLVVWKRERKARATEKRWFKSRQLPREGSYSFKFFEFHDFFHDLRFTYICHFRKFSTLYLFQHIFFTGLNSSTETNSGIHQNTCRSLCLIIPLCPTLSLLCHLL